MKDHAEKRRKWNSWVKYNNNLAFARYVNMNKQ
jgi:hypothetical protein